MDGSPNLNGSTFELLWIYLVFMNGLWVVIPLILLWDSFCRLSYTSSKASYHIDSGYPINGPSLSVFYVAGGLIVLYMILVPAVLSQAPGVPVSL